jgi:Protein of unknown function (DUF3443)
MKPRKVMVFAIVAMVLAALACAAPGFAAPNNVMNANVIHGISGIGVDQPFGAVTVCVPGTTQCQIISRLLIDTGSFGLRIFSQALTISLPVQTSGGQKIAECAYFGSVTTWGRVASADVKMGGEPTIPNLPVQVINPNFPAVGHRPTSCNGGTPIAQTPLQENFNGILGVGLVQSDCPSCVSVLPSNGQGYYSCTSTTCTQTTQPLALQVQNPVALLPPNPSNGNIPDDNGVMLKFTLPPTTGASTLTGQLIFGVNTQSDNQIPVGIGFKVYTADPTFLNFTTIFQTARIGFIDSGSNGFFYDNPSLPVCPGAPWYCPATLTGQSAINIGFDGLNSGTVNFAIDNAFVLFFTGNAAFYDLGANAVGPDFFDWGLPFFLGRRVFIGIKGKTISGVTETPPFWAYR